MPLTKKGKKIMRNMKSKYGEEAGERVFYASKNKGTISGVDRGSHGGMKRNRHFGASVADEVTHLTKTNMSGFKENTTG